MREVREDRIAGNGAGRIPYLLVRKNIKNMYLRVGDDGTVTVSAGRAFTAAQADAFVLKNRLFIDRAAKKKAAEAAVKAASDGLSYVNGETVLLYGKQVPLTVVIGRPAAVSFSETGVTMTVPENYDGEKRRKLYLREKRAYAESVMTGICQQVWPLFRPYGVPFPSISFRTMKTRWGSCRAYDKAITLNLLLIDKPLPAIEYVVVHEFAHFLHQDHSPAFYAAVARFMPDYKARRALLKK